MDSAVRDSWFALSLVQQMVNVGNEVKRALRFDAGSERCRMFLDKAIQYTDLTMQDPKNARVLPELAISKEVLEDYIGARNLDCTKEQIGKYYAGFQLLL